MRTAFILVIACLLSACGSSPLDPTQPPPTLGADFDQSFYAQLVHNAYDQPTAPQPLHRWTSTPSVYILTVRDDGPAIPVEDVDLVERVVREAIPAWTGGALAAPMIVRGTEPRGRRDVKGWLTVTWLAVGTPAHACGISDIAASGGMVGLIHPSVDSWCGCPGTGALKARTVWHEVGHALGFWHVGSGSDLMAPTGSACEQQPSARERYHAAFAYQRPVGEMNP